MMGSNHLRHISSTPLVSENPNLLAQLSSHLNHSQSIAPLLIITSPLILPPQHQPAVLQYIQLTFRELQHQSSHHNPAEEQCPICMCEFTSADSNEIVRLFRCDGHFFHRECIDRCWSHTFLRCPICGIIYGIMTGDMPEGQMIINKHNQSGMEIEGMRGHSIFEIIYNLKSGKRGNRSFSGTSRSAYLPANQEGINVLVLLIKAFERKLTFTVGRSVTTGIDNTTVWNGIHHKTSLGGGPQNFGYPDPTYLSRVREELAAKGVF